MKTKYISIITLMLLLCTMLFGCSKDSVVNTTVNTNYTQSNGFVRPLTQNNYYVTITDDYSYIADNNGVRQVDPKGNQKLLTKTPAYYPVTDSTVVLFTYKKESEDNSSQIRCINSDGTDERVLTQCTRGARSIMIYDNKLYFTDTSAQQGLFVTDLDTGKTELIEKGVVEPYTIGTTFVYISKDTSADVFGTLKTYDYTTSESKTISEVALSGDIDCYNDKIYVCSDKNSGADENAVYCYDINADSFTKLFTKKADAITLNCVADGYIYYTLMDNGTVVCFKTPIDNEAHEPINCSSMPTKTSSCVLAKRQGQYLTVSNDSMTPLENISASDYEIIEYAGKLFFVQGAYDYGNIQVFKQ